ncbi:MAG: haloacid dehalogenase-like hydrolase [Gordonia sp. (in: high G+C Gram-positive bacteria)]
MNIPVTVNHSPDAVLRRSHGIVLALDVPTPDLVRTVVAATAAVEGVVGYKLGPGIALDLGLSEASPWIGNLREVFADIAARGETAIVVSMSPLFFVERLVRWGVRHVYASRNPIGEPFDASHVLADVDKIDIVERYATAGSFDRARVVAYGDSYTDVPLFGSGIASVSVNGTEAVEALAAQRYRGENLWEAYTLGRGLVSG